jgi:N-methylhydantoinase B
MMAADESTDVSVDLDISEFDGVEKPYIPPGELDVPGDVPMHTDTVEEVDPVTYEVVRHSLWNNNLEAGETIENLAVSKITLETRDFNTAINLEDGGFVYYGPYLQYFAGVLDWNIKWILENRSADPGIEPGDMFLQNDPWVGAPHQPDVALLCPVFHDGELFCWVSNVMHQNDVGGTVPGSFCQNAPDIYSDPTPIPPIRIVEDGELRDDIVDSYGRHSRQPEHLRLDLRAGIAGNNLAKRRVKDLIESYGADTVKSVMHRVSDSSESALKKKLDAIPDGEWRTRSFHEAAMTGDDHVYEIEVGLRKDGGRVVFDNRGTHENIEGAINFSLAGFRGCLLTMLNLLMTPGEMGAVGGVARRVSFAPEPQTLSCPDYGHALSASGQYNTMLHLSAANRVIAKMMLSSDDEELRRKALSTTHAQWSMCINEGTNQRGDYFVGPMLDQMIGASAATPHEDGQFADGVPYVPEGIGPNVESYERDWPLLYLYRREQPNSGGSGYRRGGAGGELAYIQHKGGFVPGVYTHDTQPKTLGLMGAGPGSRMQLQFVRDADHEETFERGELPESTEELDGEVDYPPPKGFGTELGDDDVIKWAWMGDGGYGDPLDREPERVAADVEDGHVTEDYAREEYGVVLDEDGSVDAEATAERRADIRETRLADTKPATELAGGGDDA